MSDLHGNMREPHLSKEGKYDEMPVRTDDPNEATPGIIKPGYRSDIASGMP